MGTAMEFTDANFQQEVLESDVPVLVDFWAPWCGPCRMIGPVIEELASENTGTFRVGKSKCGRQWQPCYELQRFKYSGDHDFQGRSTGQPVHGCPVEGEVATGTR